MKEKTHPKIFLKITDRNFSEEDAKNLSYIISLYEKKKRHIKSGGLRNGFHVKMLQDAGLG